MSRSNFLLIVIGLASVLVYVAAPGLVDLRLHTIEFVVVFVAVFVLYLAAVGLVLRSVETSANSCFGSRSRLRCCST